MIPTATTTKRKRQRIWLTDIRDGGTDTDRALPVGSPEAAAAIERVRQMIGVGHIERAQAKRRAETARRREGEAA